MSDIFNTKGHRSTLSSNHSRALASTTRVKDLTDGPHTARVHYVPYTDTHCPFQATPYSESFIEVSDFSAQLRGHDDEISRCKIEESVLLLTLLDSVQREFSQSNEGNTCTLSVMLLYHDTLLSHNPPKCLSHGAYLLLLPIHLECRLWCGRDG